MASPKLEETWRQTLEEWTNSGEKVNEFCAERGFSRTSFYRWKARIEGRVRTPKPAAELASSFLPLQIVETPVRTGDAGVELLLRSGHRIRLAADFDRATLEAAIAVLEGRPC